MSLLNSPQGNSAAVRQTWQEKLQDYCRQNKVPPPVFNIVSDRRGGRTAWSSNVTVGNKFMSARYWYDGQYINNAKEDAAEVAYKSFVPNDQTGSSPVFQGQLFR